MATLVFDIETVGRSWESFDDATKKYLQKSLHSDVTEAERKEKLSELQSGFGLSPLTGEVVAVGIYDLERHKGAVYYQGDEEAEWEEGDYMFRSGTEYDLLKTFWDGAQSYNVFVTFAGRSFDAPFLALRSAALDLTPSRDLLQHRYLNRQADPYHVDLQDQFSYYGALGRKPSLHLCTNLFGIQSSKEAGVSGENVAELFQKKKFRDIARYNARDVSATAALYERWYKHLAPSSFKSLEL